MFLKNELNHKFQNVITYQVTKLILTNIC